MATADQANMQLYQRLKQKFPDIPDHVIIACVHEHQNDLQNCISHLSHISASYQFNSATELALNKQDKDHLNHYEISRLYHHPVPQNKANNNQPRYLMQKSLPCDAYYSQMRKYSGTPPMMRGGGGYQMQGHPLDGHIQSAPVMPSSYEPFVAKVSVGGSASPIPPPLPQHPPVGIPMVSTEHPHHPGSSYMQNDFESQRRQYLYNQCDWEMHVSYNQGMSGTSGSYSLSSSIQPHKMQAYSAVPRVDRPPVELMQPVRHVTSLNINPVGPHIGLYRLEPPRYVLPASSSPSQQPLHSTTVNLRLQPPSPHPQPRVQINTSGGGNVAYSATPGQPPTKSHFHFSFNPSRGGSFAAMRTRQNPHRVLPQCTVDVRPASPPPPPPPPIPTSFSSVSKSIASSTSLSFHSSSSSYSATNVMSGSVTVSTSSASCLQHKLSPPEQKSDESLSNIKKSPFTDNVLSTTLLDRTNTDQQRISEVPIQPQSPKLLSTKLKLDVNSKSENPGSAKGFMECNGEVAYVQALILHQRAQMRRLQQKLNGDKQILDTVRNEVSTMELELYNRFKPTKHPGIFDHDEIKKLREETLKLQVECYLLTREVDFLDKGQTALGETNEGFYDRLNPGQSGSIGSPPVHPNRRGSSPFSIPPPKRENYEEEQQWSCSTCTFLNNPALDKCEMCEMPRLQLASGFG